jgi:hypothetical protein
MKTLLSLFLAAKAILKGPFAESLREKIPILKYKKETFLYLAQRLFLATRKKYLKS